MRRNRDDTTSTYMPHRPVTDTRMSESAMIHAAMAESGMACSHVTCATNMPAPVTSAHMRPGVTAAVTPSGVPSMPAAVSSAATMSLSKQQAGHKAAHAQRCEEQGTPPNRAARLEPARHTADNFRFHGRSFLPGMLVVTGAWFNFMPRR